MPKIWTGEEDFDINGKIYKIKDETKACELNLMLEIIKEISYLKRAIQK